MISPRQTLNLGIACTAFCWVMLIMASYTNPIAVSSSVCFLTGITGFVVSLQRYYKEYFW